MAFRSSSADRREEGDFIPGSHRFLAGGELEVSGHERGGIVLSQGRKTLLKLSPGVGQAGPAREFQIHRLASRELPQSGEQQHLDHHGFITILMSSPTMASMPAATSPTRRKDLKPGVATIRRSGSTATVPGGSLGSGSSNGWPVKCRTRMSPSPTTPTGLPASRKWRTVRSASG